MFLSPPLLSADDFNFPSRSLNSLSSHCSTYLILKHPMDKRSSIFLFYSSCLNLWHPSFDMPPLPQGRRPFVEELELSRARWLPAWPVSPCELGHLRSHGAVLRKMQNDSGTWVFPFLQGGVEGWTFHRILPSPGEVLLAKERKLVTGPLSSGAALRKVR